MIKRKYNTEQSFEELLASEAEKFRAYPSDKVWNNIRTELHEEKKWPALLIVLTFLVITSTVTTLVFYPPKKFAVANTLTNNGIIKQNSSQVKQVSENYVIPHNITNKNINKAFVNEVLMTKSSQLINNNFVANTYQKTDVELNTIAQQNDKQTESKLSTDIIAVTNKNDNKESELSTSTNSGDENKSSAAENSITSNKTSALKTNETNTCLNSLKPKDKVAKKTSKWMLQFYTTPSVSYRVLEDDKSRANYTNNQADLAALKNNVDDIVHQKPALGNEFGVALLFPVKKNFFFKTGLQFNVRQYFVGATQQTGIAKIDYVNNNQLKTISYEANYSTAQTNNSVELDNRVYQLSVPIGFQWNFIDGQRWGVAFGTTIQPTVTLNKSIYLVSTDYKYYTDGTPFFRKMNINTSTELLFTLKSGNNKWVFGPQVRYQQMPTYNDLYPIKEYRVDYGIKIGFIKNL